MSTRHGGMRRQFILSPPFTATSGFETHGQMKQSDIDIDIGSAQQRDEEGRCPCHGHRSLRLGGPRARALDPETKVRHHRLDSRRPPRGSSPNLSPIAAPKQPTAAPPHSTSHIHNVGRRREGAQDRATRTSLPPAAASNASPLASRNASSSLPKPRLIHALIAIAPPYRIPRMPVGCVS